jgi:hypothetical protein
MVMMLFVEDHPFQQMKVILSVASSSAVSRTKFLFFTFTTLTAVPTPASSYVFGRNASQANLLI